MLAWIELQGEDVIREEFANGIDSFARDNDYDGLGDDGMCSTNHPDFNLAFLIKFCGEKLGVVMTDPTKSGVIPDSFPVEKWNYLKRGFNPVGGVVWAPIEEESILKNINWFTPTPELPEEEAHYQFCVAALQECAATGDERFLSLYRTITRAYYEAFPEAVGCRKFRSFAEEQEIQRNNLLVDKDGTAALWVRAKQDYETFAHTWFRR
jgi:hypothetical protein